MKDKFYYIFKDDKYIDTCNGIKALAEFLKRPPESVYESMRRNIKQKRNSFILRDNAGNKYIVYDEIQFFGKSNIKGVK